MLGADLVLADGVGVVYSAKILGRPLKGKVPGIDFAQRLLAWMARHGKRLFLLGAKPGVAELAAANLKDAHPGLIVCGTHDGYFREDGPVVEEIRAAAADVVERAPEGFQRLGLEWLYRLAKEPKRIGRMAKLPLVLVQAAGARLRGK